MIIRKTERVTRVEPSKDFKVDVIYVTPEFIELSTPQSNYGMRGQLSLFQNPIMRLKPEQQEVCALDFDYIKRRLALTTRRSPNSPTSTTSPPPPTSAATCRSTWASSQPT